MVSDTKPWVFGGHSGWRGAWEGRVGRRNTLALCRHPGCLWRQHRLGMSCCCCCCCCWVTSVVSDSVRPHRQQPTRLPSPWDSPSKNTGVGCHFLLQCMKVKSESEVAQSCPTLSQPHGLQPTRLLRPWDFLGKSAGVGCHRLLRGWAAAGG